VRERAAKVLRVLRAQPGPGLLIPGGNVFDLAFSKDGHLLAVGCDDGGVRLYDARTGALRHTLTGHRAIVYGVAFSPDGKKLVTCSGAYNRDGQPPGEIILWDLATARAEATLPGPPGGFAWITFSPEGKHLYSVGSDGMIRLWDLSAHKEIKAVSGGNNRPVRRSFFTPDGKLLGTAGMGSAVRFWTPGDLTLTRQVQAHPTGAGTLAFSPDGKYLLTASRAGAPPTPGEIRVWDLASLTEKRAITGHKGKVLALAVSPDSTLLAVGGGISQEYGEVKLFDLATGAERASFDGHDEWVECVTFSPDGQWLASGSGFSRGRPGQVRIWDVKRRVARGE
jgi:WD40 repeat protein